MNIRRRRAIGAELTNDGAHFRLWAPAHERVRLVLGDGHELDLEREPSGHFSLFVEGVAAGARYAFRPGRAEKSFPDPASRFQPDGVHAASAVVDPSTFAWSDPSWRGIDPARLVISEIHIGTFTPEGTWRAAAAKLPLLADAGINCVEVMPVAEFPGRFGWGYDGVDLWAPTRLYGTPDDFRAFVDAAHAHGIAVLLDVVYNHLGPDGCYLTQFTPAWFTKKYENEWGDAINFDAEGSEGVREYFIENAAYWIDEYHLDGIRFDATQSIHDDSPTHVLAEITTAARKAANGRALFLVGENEPQKVRLIRPLAEGGCGLDALWNDDFHHSATVALTGRHEAYYTDYRGTPQELVSAAKHGFLYQGQWYSWQKQPRGTSSRGLPRRKLVLYLENHDQIANSARGTRTHLLTSPGRWRAMTSLLLLLPGTPMLFQGEEFGSTSPFLYFADHDSDLAKAVASGRGEFLSQFPSVAAIRSQLIAPQDPAAFETSRLDWDERVRNGAVVALHRDLLRLRREDAVLSDPEVDLDGAVLGDEAFVLRFSSPAGERLLLVNLGRDLELRPMPEPLLAAPEGKRWTLLFASESPEYGGNGNAEMDLVEQWRVAGHAALVLGA